MNSMDEIRGTILYDDSEQSAYSKLGFPEYEIPIHGPPGVLYVNLDSSGSSPF